MLRTCVRSILNLPRHPDVVVATGDLTDCGLEEEFRLLNEILSPLPMPVFLLPGNHDRREEMVKALPQHTYLSLDDGFLHYTIDDYPVKLIALDSVVPGYGHGELCPARLAWLQARLEERKADPVMVMLHHPPFPTGIASMDSINCRNGAELADIIQRYPNVERVIAGHHHRPIQVRYAGTIGSVAPSTAHQVLMDLSGEAVDDQFIMEPPAFHLHLWTPESGVITHQSYIGPFDGPHPFVLDPDYPGQAA